jgi:hypothetical protein
MIICSAVKPDCCECRGWRECVHSRRAQRCAYGSTALVAKSRLLAEAGEPVACHWTKTFFHQSETFFESDEPQL